ncbi:MAG: nitroreductase family protein [Desulfobacterales bacterium]
MSDFMSVIKERRSIRNFENKSIPEDFLNTVLESVRWAPSWANTQCWEVVIVKDIDKKQKLQKTIAPKNPATKAIIAAPVVLAICGKLGISGYYKDKAATKFGDWFMYDVGLATQNLCLTAHLLGLGTVIVGMFDHDKAKAALGVPDSYEMPILIPIGYPSKVSKIPKRKEISDFVHYNSF